MKQILRSLFNKLGYDFIKINMHSADKAGKVMPVKVGNYKILMPGNNPQISVYKYYPDANTQLARLAKIIVAKYKDTSMIDVGANVGDTIAVVRSQINIPIIAIEGDRFSFSFLLKNTRQLNDVFILNQFLGEEKKEMYVSMEKEGWNNTIIPDEKGTTKLDLKTLDEVIEENKLEGRNIKLLKIDTEGFDTIILRGCRKTIAKDKPVIYLEYNGESMNKIGEDGLSTLLSLQEYGYKTIHIYDCINNLIMVTTLKNTDSLRQLHEYAHKQKSMIPYYDICVFHDNDDDLSKQFHESER